MTSTRALAAFLLQLVIYLIAPRSARSFSVSRSCGNYGSVRHVFGRFSEGTAVTSKPTIRRRSRQCPILGQDRQYTVLRLSNSDNIGRKPTHRRTFVTNFKSGVRQVHENYLDIFFSATQFAALPMAVLGGSTGIGYIISPSLGRSIVTVLLKILIRVAVTTMSLIRVLILPLLLLVGVVVELVPSIAGSPSSTTTPQGISASKPGSVVGALFMVLVVVPFIEEFIFRRVILAELKRFWPRAKKKKNKTKPEEAFETHDDNKAPRLFGYTPWVLISSILFAASHIHNHTRHFLTGLQFTSGTERLVIRLVLRAFAQCLVTCYLSLQVFSPVFETNGMAASLGAHIWWNLNTIYAPVTIPVRVFQRFRCYRQNRLLKDGIDN